MNLRKRLLNIIRTWIDRYTGYIDGRNEMKPLHWNTQITAAKNKSIMLDVKASAYEFVDVYRICFNSQKQKYYFEIPSENIYFLDDIKEAAELYFKENRSDIAVAKCIRCSKWNVLDGQFCPRCKQAIKSPGNTEIEIEP